MKRSLNNLVAYRIYGSDGTEGNVNDFLFDEEAWIIRYIEAGFKDLQPSRILIPRSSLKTINWQEKKIELNINKTNIESSPSLDKNTTVSREYEKKLIQHYRVDSYWPYSYLPPTDSHFYFPPRPLRVPNKEIHEDDLSSDWLKSISFMKSEINVELKTDQIKHAPEFDPSHPIDMDYEKALHDYHQQLKHATS